MFCSDKVVAPSWQILDPHIALHGRGITRPIPFKGGVSGRVTEGAHSAVSGRLRSRGVLHLAYRRPPTLKRAGGARVASGATPAHNPGGGHGPRTGRTAAGIP